MELLEMLFSLCCGSMLFVKSFAGEGKGGDDDTDYGAEVEKRGAKNVILENRQKADDLAKANQKIKDLESKPSHQESPKPNAPVVEPDYIKELRAAGEEEGLSKKFIDIQIKALGRMTTEVSTHVVEASTRQRTGFTKNMDKLAKDDEYKFIMSKYGKEVGDYVQNEFPSAVWNDAKVYESAVGIIANKHRKELYGKGAGTVEDPPNETGDSDGDKNDNAYGGISRKEIEDYALSINYTIKDLKDKDIRKSVIGAYKAKYGDKK